MQIKGLTVVTAQVPGAPAVVALDSFSAVDEVVLVGTRVVRAERLAALIFLAFVAFTLDVLGVLDRRVTVGAHD